MKLTLDKITNEMRTAYFDETGQNSVPFSDTDSRLKVAAAELFSAYSYAEYIFRQAFVQTASGKYLDCHAQLRGIERKKAERAKGRLRFYVMEPLEADAVIPSGTVCAPSDKPFIQFETTENATICAGTLYCTAEACAVDNGEKYNVSAEEINVIVNPPKYISRVVNDSAFNGGADDETDESLRERLLDIYKYESNALNASSVRCILLSCNNVRDASVVVQESGVRIILKLSSADALDSAKKEIEEKLGFLKLLGFELYIETAAEKAYGADVDVKAYSGADFGEIRQLVESKIRDFCGMEKIGSTVRAYDIARFLADMDSVYDINIALSPSVSGCVPCGAGEYLKLRELRVNIHE